MSNHPIDAGPITRVACKYYYHKSRSDNGQFVIGFVAAIASLLVGLIMFASALTDPASEHVREEGIVLMILGSILWPGVEGMQRHAQKNKVRGSDGSSVTDTYFTLLPHNREIAAPLIHSIYELENSGQNGYGEGISQRRSLLYQIVEKDRADRVVRTDDSDIEAVKAILAAHKEIKA